MNNRRNRGRKIKKICAAAAFITLLVCGNARASVFLLPNPGVWQAEKNFTPEEAHDIYRVDYYGAQLSSTERKVYDTLYDQYYVGRQLDGAALTLHLPGFQEMSQTEQKNRVSNLFSAAVTAFLTDYQLPLSDGYRWECKSLGDTVELKCYMAELYPGALAEYAAAQEGIRVYKSELDEKIRIRFGEEGNKDKFAVLLTLHDDMIDRITYSYSSGRVNRDEESGDYYNNRIGNTMASVALDKYNHYAVCQGYMAAVKELCDLYGIPCIRVDKKQRPGEKAGHSWVYVKLDDGMWYSLDVTLDDLEDGDHQKTSHQYFLTGVAELDSEHIPYIPLQENGRDRLAVLPSLAPKAAPDINLYLGQGK